MGDAICLQGAFPATSSEQQSYKLKFSGFLENRTKEKKNTDQQPNTHVYFLENPNKTQEISSSIY